MHISNYIHDMSNGHMGVDIFWAACMTPVPSGDVVLEVPSSVMVVMSEDRGAWHTTPTEDKDHGDTGLTLTLCPMFYSLNTSYFGEDDVKNKVKLFYKNLHIASLLLPLQL